MMFNSDNGVTSLRIGTHGYLLYESD